MPEEYLRTDVKGTLNTATQGIVPDDSALKVIHVNQDERKDSIEWGSSTKGGAALKIYFNAANPETACEYIDNAMVVRAYAKQALAIAMDAEKRGAQ